ncbi:OmpH family outer membrane protein [Segatella copri]|uniref:OmpH family outer membrane protein n=1 Tax=Segatella copri TaxID=165179 RepID=UPI001C389CB2|nr:OmpH family outer membrane protein [Segatella copri]MBV3401213.1 OmpH family outer membrane protein [Segatella copri]MBW0047943.1 OmpH family outer membrane protein [Segatella copri]
MKKNLLFLAFALFALSASAQQNPAVGAQQATTAAQPVLRFGYFSFEQVFHTMPGYAIAKHNMDELRGKYDEETKRVETEFNSKYEEFLDGQRSYAKSILEKRQAELRELMEKNIAFKAEAARLLKKAEEEAYAPLKAKMNAALQQIGKENGFAFILNTDNNATPYLSAEMGVDITETLKEKIK